MTGVAARGTVDVMSSSDGSQFFGVDPTGLFYGSEFPGNASTGILRLNDQRGKKSSFRLLHRPPGYAELSEGVENPSEPLTLHRYS